jgi:solute carrier family 25 2-oxodicarboxylate transporter 21
MSEVVKKRKANAMDQLPPSFGMSMVVAATMYPVDVIRALCMANPGMSAGTAFKTFVDAHGLTGFITQGLGAELMRGGSARTIKFWMWPVMHEGVYGKKLAKGDPVSKGIAGALATFPEVIFISPLENMKLCAQLDKEGKFKGTGDIASHLVKTRGMIGGLYIGYLGMQFRQVLFTGGSLGTMDLFKSQFKAMGVSNQLACDTLGGFASGIVGVILNCWAEVTRTVIQKQVVADTFKPEIPRPPVTDVINPAILFGKVGEIMSTQGIGGLYAGFVPKCFHLGGSMALVGILLPRFNAAWYSFMNIEP